MGPMTGLLPTYLTYIRSFYKTVHCATLLPSPLWAAPAQVTLGAGGCFPALGFQMPSAMPSSLDGWWCDMSDEYAFVGFSYEVTACQSLRQLRREFLDIRNTFGGRYVRLDNIVTAAWEAGLGVHALIWFGFDGTDEWIGRRDSLLATLHSNPRAKFVTRVLQFGSEPLYDGVLDPDDLARKSHRRPHAAFFSQQASTANNSWPDVMNDLNWFLDHGEGKKIYLSENGWPSVTSEGVQPNSPDAVANVQNEADYYTLLDSKCSFFKTVQGGGVGWFAHIYSDSQEPGYGIYNTKGSLKFNFSPRTAC
ncbi:hypothetical protein BDZ89DRAFT_1072248 [Hymenopellis radicata]|nr:hypothetical protein BDZ89DRAFT_1072248 [Hymenopellis radicata]